MNDTKNLDAKACIDGLKDVILDVLVETGHTGNYIELKDIREKSGINDQFVTKGDENLKGQFTRQLLFQLKAEKLVDSHLNAKGEKEWKIAKKGLEKLRNR